MPNTTPEIPFSIYRKYLADGELPDSFSEEVNPSDLMTMQALYWRRQAMLKQQDGQVDVASEYRNKSRETLVASQVLVDSHILEHVFDLEAGISLQGEAGTLISLLNQLGFSKAESSKRLPVPSSLNPELLNHLQKHFLLTIIPDDQLGLTDSWTHVLGKSEIPEWYTAIQQLRKETETVNLFAELKERWFIFLIIMLGVAAAASFTFDIGVEIARLSDQFILFLSVYGGLALTRSTWQLRKAEKWHKRARSYNRTPIVNALADLTHTFDPVAAEEIRGDGHELVEGTFGWDQFKTQIGIKESKNPNYISLVDRYIAAARRSGYDITRDEAINHISERIIDTELNGKTPSVAVVIPSYQVKPDRIEKLLYSIKDQAYPVTTVFVVYNDDPNGSPEKQQEFSHIQRLIDKANATPGRNKCQVKLLAQPSRGKREAMAMGFVAAMGSGYKDEIVDNYIKDYAKLHPGQSIKESREELQEMANEMIANLNIGALPDFKHDRVLNIDSDTWIEDPMAVLNAELMKNAHPNAGCITGDVRVETRHVNLLTEMTFQRYWHAFFRERSAQSEAQSDHIDRGQVTCASGPFVYMDADKLGEILPDWYFFTHIAGRGTFGDDRDASTRFTERGYGSFFCPDSAVWTDCPEDYPSWLNQQTRWNKSFTIYNMVLFGFLHKMDKYVQMDTIYQQTFPFALLFIMANIAAEAAKIGFEQGPLAGVTSILPYALTVLTYNELFFGIYGTLRNRIEQADGTYKPDYRFLMSPVYIYYHFRYLLRVKLYTFYDLFIKKNTAWGTKGEEFEKQFLAEFRAQQAEMVDEIVAEIVETYESGNVPFEEPDMPTDYQDFDFTAPVVEPENTDD